MDHIHNIGDDNDEKIIYNTLAKITKEIKPTNRSEEPLKIQFKLLLAGVIPMVDVGPYNTNKFDFNILYDLLSKRYSNFLKNHENIKMTHIESITLPKKPVIILYDVQYEKNIKNNKPFTLFGKIYGIKKDHGALDFSNEIELGKQYTYVTFFMPNQKLGRNINVIDPYLKPVTSNLLGEQELLNQMRTVDRYINMKIEIIHADC